MKKARVSIVVAMSSKKRAMGNRGKLLWHIPDDLKRFKTLTLEHPVIMGRKTYQSIVSYVGGPLPGRTNIVISRNALCIDGALVYQSFESALEAACAIDQEEVYIGGGSEIYKLALPYADRLYLTLVDNEPEADTYFPEYSMFTTIIAQEKRDHNGLRYEWITLEK